MTFPQIRELDAGSWFHPTFPGEKVPTIAEVLQLVAEYGQHKVLIAVDLKAKGVGTEVVRLAKKHDVLHRLLFIGRTIAKASLRQEIKQTSRDALTAVVANTGNELQEALKDKNADWISLRLLPSRAQFDAVHESGRKALIAGPTVSGRLPSNWQRGTEVGIDAIRTDYPLDLRSQLRDKSVGK